MGRALLIIARLLAALLVAGVAVWGALALWYRLPGPGLAGSAAAALWLLASLIALYALLGSRWRPLIAYAALFAAILVWWAGIAPRNDKDWAPDVARSLTGEVEGHELHLANVRDFDWRSETQVAERWEDASFDLDDLESLDLFASYWGGPSIAHTIISFGFKDGRHLAFSVEVRRRRGEAYSTIAGLFKEDELAIIAATERDVVRVRSNVRGEDVRLFRLRVTPEEARRALVALVEEANDIAARPRFYDTLTTNCTTVLLQLARRLGRALPFDWRIMLTGYLPDYGYDQGLLDRDLPLAELRERGRIRERALAADAGGDFSRLIREGVPGP